MSAAVVSGLATMLPLFLIAVLSNRSDSLVLGLAVLGLAGFAVFVIVIAGVRRAAVKAKAGGVSFEAGWGDDVGEQQRAE